MADPLDHPGTGRRRPAGGPHDDEGVDRVGSVIYRGVRQDAQARRTAQGIETLGDDAQIIGTLALGKDRRFVQGIPNAGDLHRMCIVQRDNRNEHDDLPSKTRMCQ
jgi:hypothetical protein